MSKGMWKIVKAKVGEVLENISNIISLDLPYRCLVTLIN